MRSLSTVSTYRASPHNVYSSFIFYACGSARTVMRALRQASSFVVLVCASSWHLSSRHCQLRSTVDSPINTSGCFVSTELSQLPLCFAIALWNVLPDRNADDNEAVPFIKNKKNQCNISLAVSQNLFSDLLFLYSCVFLYFMLIKA